MNKQKFAYGRMRRRHLWALAGAAWWPALGSAEVYLPPSPTYEPLRALEKRAGGRLGVAMLHTGSGAIAGNRLRERFGMGATVALPLVAGILHAVDQGHLRLDQWVPFSEADLVAYAPVTSQHLGQGGMPLEALAHAAQTGNDDLAANLLLKLLGGPSAFTSQMRASNDPVTRLDRMLPQMHFVSGGDIRDTTTPQCMAQTTALYLTQGWLSPASTGRLCSWMEATPSGAGHLRAGLPGDWRAGDRSGAAPALGLDHKRSDIAIAWPLGRQSALVIAAYFEGRQAGPDQRQAVLAEVGRIAARWYLQQA